MNSAQLSETLVNISDPSYEVTLPDNEIKSKQSSAEEIQRPDQQPMLVGNEAPFERAAFFPTDSKCWWGRRRRMNEASKKTLKHYNWLKPGDTWILAHVP